ncbi:MAG TPA: phospholipase D family protein [Anaerolineae bacterium]|nr:phospholipase D family protein [Anaerolineae bacterium]
MLSSAEADVLISSPYVTQDGVGFMAEHISSRVRAQGRICLLTDLSPLNVSQGSTDPHAVRSLNQLAPNVEVYHLPRLHAKVYVADVHHAAITSANLTRGGLSLNYEYGVGIEHSPSVSTIRRDVTEYAELGARVTFQELAVYCQAADRVRSALQGQQRQIAQTARRALEEALQDAADELIRIRVSGGAIHPVFAKTIVYLLQREGPLTTAQLHHMIEQIHPDLCDNSVDRVINGVRFGKKWKHAVRTAQQGLKRRGLVQLEDGRWVLVGPTGQMLPG